VNPVQPADPQKLRLATAANIFLPGAGLFVLGHRRSGGVLAGLFLICFLAVFFLFLIGYVNYLSASMDPDVLKDGKLEEIGRGFHANWLLAIAVMGGIIYAIASVLFSRAKRVLQAGQA
jgi:hypothetical protein